MQGLKMLRWSKTSVSGKTPATHSSSIRVPLSEAGLRPSWCWLSPALPDGTRAEAHLVQIPDKQPLIQLSERPPNLETPIQGFRTTITPNDQFFVRYHLAGIPDAKSLESWKLVVGGDAAERSVTFGIQQLNELPQTEVIAVCQCSGNRRGLPDEPLPRAEALRAGGACVQREPRQTPPSPAVGHVEGPDVGAHVRRDRGQRFPGDVGRGSIALDRLGEVLEMVFDGEAI